MYVSNWFPNPRPLNVQSCDLRKFGTTGLENTSYFLLQWTGEEARHRFYAANPKRCRFEQLNGVVDFFERLCNPPPPPPLPFIYRRCIFRNKQRTCTCRCDTSRYTHTF